MPRSPFHLVRAALLEYGGGTHLLAAANGSKVTLTTVHGLGLQYETQTHRKPENVLHFTQCLLQ